MAVEICSALRSYTASRTHTVSASTRCDTQAPPTMNFSAAPTCAASSRATKRTKTFVSTARMPFSAVLSDTCLYIRGTCLSRRLRKECLMDILRAIPSRPTYDDMIVLLVPLKYGTRPNA